MTHSCLLYFLYLFVFLLSKIDSATRQGQVGAGLSLARVIRMQDCLILYLK